MSAAKHRLTFRDVFTDGRIALMLPLGFSAGLPFLLVFSTLSTWLREAGVSRTEIGLLSWIGFAYAWKFLWAPVIDRYDVPGLSRLLGRARGWMALAQILIAVGLVGIALSDPKTGLTLTVLAALLVAFASATQDVVIDGWRINAAETSRQGMMAAAYQLGYRLALICAGAGALYIAEFVNWRAAYIAMAGMMAVGLLGTLLAPSTDRAIERERLPAVAPPADPAGRDDAIARATRFLVTLFRAMRKAVVDPLADLVHRKETMVVAILVLVALYRLPDFMAGVMANPLYIDLKFSKVDIANVSKLYGVWVGMIGAFAGGLALTRVGMWPTLLVGGLIGAVSNLVFTWLALEGVPRLDLLTVAISVDNFASGFAGVALIAYMSSLTSPAFAATQYALLSSLYALPGKFIGGFSGIVADRFGYEFLFTGTALLSIPIVILCFVVRRDTMATEARDEEASMEPALPVAAASRT